MNAPNITVSAVILGCSLALTGCLPMYGPGWQQDTPPVAYSRDLHPGYGSVYAIDVIRPDNGLIGGIGAGAIAGAVIGGILGHQIGDGNGNTAATVIGAAGGALIGHQIEKSTQAQGDQFRLTIRMEHGGFQSVVKNTDFIDLRVGDRIHIDNGGNVRRY